MSGAVQALLALLFPERCACCRAITGGGPLCKGCGEKLTRLGTPECRPRHSGGTDRIVAVYAYGGAGAALMRAFKFRGRQSCYEALRPTFEKQMARLLAAEVVDVVTCVPMGRASQRRRGFNQAERIARPLAEYLELPYEALLEKCRQNRTQHDLSAGERLENVRDVYAARRPLAGQTVLLVDDIVTTGATLSACTRVLKAAGAGRVVCAAVLARL